MGVWGRLPAAILSDCRRQFWGDLEPKTVPASFCFSMNNNIPIRVQIRAAEHGDAETLHRLVRELAEYEHLEHEVASTPAAFAEHFFGEKPFARALLAVAGRSGAAGGGADGAGGTGAIGFAVWFPTYSTFAGRPGAFLEDLYVCPAHRKHGVGKALFDGFAADAAAHGCRRLEWRALNWNAPALDFYRRQGAVVLEDWLTLRREVP
jgi:GNAT superfamily N-acetyltransferase